MSRRRVTVRPPIAWLVAVFVFGSLQYSTHRWVLDDAQGAARSAVLTTALWAVLFGLFMWWWSRGAGNDEG